MDFSVEEEEVDLKLPIRQHKEVKEEKEEEVQLVLLQLTQVFLLITIQVVPWLILVAVVVKKDLEVQDKLLLKNQVQHQEYGR
jgi:ABC-type uncharacterized transport system involved in gliding motility auxiliary subunit